MLDVSFGLNTMKVHVIFTTKNVIHDISFVRVVTNLIAVVVKKLNPSSLPHVKLLLIENVLEDFVVGENHKFCHKYGASKFSRRT